jgi:serine protease Do
MKPKFQSVDSETLAVALRPAVPKRPNRIVLVLSLVLALGFFSQPRVRADSRRSPVVVAVQRVRPAVVNISTIVRERVGFSFPFSGNDFFRDFFPELFSREYTRTSLGSGVIIDGAKGYIVTNHHVISRAAEIKVMTSDQKEYQAQILGSDPRSDLAVLEIESQETLPEIAMGNSDDLMIGETVIAIGNPFGLSHTVTTGVVSAVNRSVRSDQHIYRNFIQTDASINPGNSGGPLLNIEGELIGINTAIYQKAQGIGFAIPINKAKRIVRELIRSGEVRFPWLGLEVQELTPELKGAFRLPDTQTGILVNDVISESPADRAGLKRGDVLTALEGMGVSSPSDYREVLAEFTPGDRLQLTFFRKGKEMGVRVQPEVFPLDLTLDLVDRRLGIKVGEIDTATRRRYGLEGGVSIEYVRGNSEAGRIGLQAGDLIFRVNKLPIMNMDEFKKAIRRYHYLPSLTLLVRRGPYGYSLTLPF